MRREEKQEMFLSPTPRRRRIMGKVKMLVSGKYDGGLLLKHLLTSKVKNE